MIAQFRHLHFMSGHRDVQFFEWSPRILLNFAARDSTHFAVIETNLNKKSLKIDDNRACLYVDLFDNAL